jgi:hypothetical protein
MKLRVTPLSGLYKRILISPQSRNSDSFRIQKQPASATESFVLDCSSGGREMRIGWLHPNNIAWQTSGRKYAAFDHFWTAQAFGGIEELH